MKKLTVPKNKKIIIGGMLLILALVFGGIKAFGKKSTSPTYQTAQVEKGTLVTSVSASGMITTGNNLTIVTSATGTVNRVYVKNGDMVKEGQKIADIVLDQDAKQKQASAWASYLSALNAEKNASQGKMSSDTAMWQAHQSLLTAQNNSKIKSENTINPETKKEYTDFEKQSIDAALVQAQKAFDAAQEKYVQSDSSIAVSKAQVTSAWYAYQQLSSTVTAPRSGMIGNLTVAPGSVISVQSSSSSSGTTPQKLGTIIQPNENVQASVDIAEIDVPKVQPEQKVTLTLDAFADKTFTGKVLIVDTNGSVSSGVTTYPATIVFDTAAPNIYPNMAVTAQIITNVKNDVLLIPSYAIQTTSGESTVQVMKNNQPVTVAVEVGAANDTQTEIVSGLQEGDTVVTSVASTTTTKSTSNTTSPFGMGGARGMGAVGGSVRIEKR